MKRIIRIGTAIGLALATSTVLAQPIKIVGLLELSGTGATSGTNFDNGVTGTVQQTVPLPAGALAFATNGYGGIYGIVVYERDNAPQ